ncbi:hypothetical protein SAMN05443144_1141, partial [Fodinibius roseus]
MRILFVLLITLLFMEPAFAQKKSSDTDIKTNISGVVPETAMVADHAPRTEAGIGALMPW